MISGPELILIIIALCIILLWGPEKLPKLARGIGQAIHEFRKAKEGKVEEEKR